MHSTILDVRTDLGVVAPSRRQSVGSNPIDLAENDFGLLAAIGPVLRQFSVASRLACVSMTSASAYELAPPIAAYDLLRTPVLAVDLESSPPRGGGDQLDQIGTPMPNGFLRQGRAGQQDAARIDSPPGERRHDIAQA